MAGVRGRQCLGEFELTFVSDGSFLLDGGAMFGVVPKTLWQKKIQADPENRVRLGLNSVLVRTGKEVVLIETGLGGKVSPKMRAIVQNQEQLPASLEAAGVTPDEVTHVINTHLHWDHCGWNTVQDASGALRPMFKNARYFCAAGELAHGRLQLDRDRVSYLAPNYDPVIAGGHMTLIDLDGRGSYTPTDQRLRGAEELPPVSVQTTAEIVPGVWVERLPGHTEEMLAVHIEGVSAGGAREHACYVSDLIPTAHHLEPTWVMGFDLDPLRCIEERKRFLNKAIVDHWMVLFTHDYDTPAANLEVDERGKAVAAGLDS